MMCYLLDAALDSSKHTTKMKGVNHLTEKIADPDNLRLAFWKARKGKNHTSGVVSFRSNLGKNLILLREQILSGLIEVGNYHYFKVYEPKERQICAAPFDERVLHHALMNICHPYFERHQISDSYASRKGKGTSNHYLSCMDLLHQERIKNKGLRALHGRYGPLV